MAETCTIPATIVITDGEGEEQSVTLQVGDEGPILIGRAPDNHLQIISPFISRHHGEIWPHEKGIIFRDLNSTSGSYRLGSRVEEQVLTVGDFLHLGSPDGVRLRVSPLDDETDHGTAGSQTEILRIADLNASRSLFLTGTLSSADPQAKRSTQGKNHEKRLQALIEMTSELLEVSDADNLADRLLKKILDHLEMDRGMVLFEHDGELTPRVWAQRSSGEVPKTQSGFVATIALSALLADDSQFDDQFEQPELPFEPVQTVTSQVFREGVGLLSLDARQDERLDGSKSVVLQSVRAIMSAPIASSDRVYGVIYLDTCRPMGRNDEDALDWLVAVAHQAGMAMRGITLIEEQRALSETMMKGLAASIDARDGMTAGHSARVAHYSVGIAEYLGLEAEEQYRTYFAGLLHDYGKIGVDDAVLRKPARLTPEEYDHIKLHPKYTFDILSKIAFPPKLKDLPLLAASHHERWDGKGYPWNMVGEEIPLIGRIIAIADVYDSLTQKRHYREPMPVEEVLEYLEEGRNKAFCTTCLDAFFRYHQEVLTKRGERKARKKKRHEQTEDDTEIGKNRLGHAPTREHGSHVAKSSESLS